MLPSGGFSIRELPTLLWITNSWTRHPPEEWLFLRELPANRQGIHWRNGIPPGITYSQKRNIPKEWDFAGNNQLMQADSHQPDQNARENSLNGNNFRISNFKSSVLLQSIKKI
jgi:hypothetical protein